MLKIAKLAAAITFVVGGLRLSSLDASAMPALDTQPAQAAQAEGASGVEQARVVCGPFRCFFQGRKQFRSRQHRHVVRRSQGARRVL